MCLVTGENAEDSGAALRDQVLREIRKVWFRNVAVVEDSLWGCCFVFRWHKAFKDGRESVEDEQRAGRPSSARTENNVARVKIVLDRDRRLQVRLITEEVGLTENGRSPNHYGRSAHEKNLCETGAEEFVR